MGRMVKKGAGVKKLLLFVVLALVSCNLWKDKGQSGRFVVAVNSQYGYINRNGDTVVTPQLSPAVG